MCVCIGFVLLLPLRRGGRRELRDSLRDCRGSCQAAELKERENTQRDSVRAQILLLRCGLSLSVSGPQSLFVLPCPPGDVPGRVAVGAEMVGDFPIGTREEKEHLMQTNDVMKIIFFSFLSHTWARGGGLLLRLGWLVGLLDLLLCLVWSGSWCGMSGLLLFAARLCGCQLLRIGLRTRFLW